MPLCHVHLPLFEAVLKREEPAGPPQGRIPSFGETLSQALDLASTKYGILWPAGEEYNLNRSFRRNLRRHSYPMIPIGKSMIVFFAENICTSVQYTKGFRAH